MPVWAAIVVPLIVFCWAAWLIIGWIDGIRERHRNAESFMEWMRQARDHWDA